MHFYFKIFDVKTKKKCSRNFKCVRYFPKDIYLRATSEVTIFHVAASQMCNFPSGNFPKVRLGPLRRSRLQCEPSTADRFGWGTKRCSQNRLRLRTAARIHLGSYRMGNCTFGRLPHGKIPLESCPLGLSFERRTFLIHNRTLKP